MDLDKRTYAHQSVEVVNEDVDVGVLTFSPGVDISGVIQIEGGKARPPDLRVSLQQSGPSMTGSPSAEVKLDGSFVLHDVGPSVYQLNLGAVPGAYLKSIKLGDHPLQDRRIDLTQGGGQLAIVLASDVAEVDGSVKKADGEPAVRVRVTLVPEGDQFGRQELSRFTFSDEKGQFKIANVPPGDYKIFAWEEVQAGAPQDSEFRKPFEKRGVALKIPPNGHANADLTMISVNRKRFARRAISSKSRRLAAEASLVGRKLPNCGGQPIDLVLRIVIMRRGAHDYGQRAPLRVEQRAWRARRADIDSRSSQMRLHGIGFVARDRECDDGCRIRAKIMDHHALDLAEPAAQPVGQHPATRGDRLDSDRLRIFHRDTKP